MNNNAYCIIMAGGIGSRFWPLSRNNRPKQFLDILGVGKSFIRQTYDRFARIIPKENILVVTGTVYKNLVLEQIPELNETQVLCEPMRRNTAPCIAYASYRLLQQNPNARVIVTPADHLILNEQSFLEVMLNCIEYTERNDALVTVGLMPTRPETGYGYIQINRGQSKLCRDTICKVKTFTEKPNYDTAKVFMSSGEFYWNSGIFIWTLSSIKNALQKYLPEIASIFEKGTAVYNTPEEANFIAQAYSQCPNISIDYGIMEKADNVYVFGADFGWSDVGTWSSLYLQLDKDSDNNAVKAQNTFIQKTSDCMIDVENPKKLVVIKDLHNFMVVDTNDVLMICPKSQEDAVKQTVTEVLAKHKDFS